MTDRFMKHCLAIAAACLVTLSAGVLRAGVGAHLAALKYGNARARRGAVWQLGRSDRSDHAKVREHLQGLLSDRDPLVRATAVWAFGELSEP